MPHRPPDAAPPVARPPLSPAPAPPPPRPPPAPPTPPLSDIPSLRTPSPPWYRRIASRVLNPNNPSAGPGSYPSDASPACTIRRAARPKPNDDSTSSGVETAGAAASTVPRAGIVAAHPPSSTAAASPAACPRTRSLRTSEPELSLMVRETTPRLRHDSTDRNGDLVKGWQHQGEHARAGANVVPSVVLRLAGCWFGMAAAWQF